MSVSASATQVSGPLTLTVNGSTRTVDVTRDTPLLYVLRNDFELNGPKYGCGLGQCGACTVLLDGGPARSCVVPVAAAIGRETLTLEGLERWTRCTRSSGLLSMNKQRNAATALTA